jgi:hypothetical protein
MRHDPQANSAPTPTVGGPRLIVSCLADLYAVHSFRFAAGIRPRNHLVYGHERRRGTPPPAGRAQHLRTTREIAVGDENHQASPPRSWTRSKLSADRESCPRSEGFAEPRQFSRATAAQNRPQPVTLAYGSYDADGHYVWH